MDFYWLVGMSPFSPSRPLCWIYIIFQNVLLCKLRSSCTHPCQTVVVIWVSNHCQISDAGKEGQTKGKSVCGPGLFLLFPPHVIHNVTTQLPEHYQTLHFGKGKVDLCHLWTGMTFFPSLPQDAGGQQIGFLLGSCGIALALTTEVCLKGLPKTQNGEIVQFKG